MLNRKMAVAWVEPPQTDATQEDEHWARTAIHLLGMSVAVADMSSGRVLWSSEGFDAVMGGRAVGLSTLESVLPGFGEVVAEFRRSAASSHAQVMRASARTVQLTLQLIETDKVLISATDLSREVKARQRHLEDREQLLFTSRVLSLGEMATTLAHEINQPVGTAANLLRGVVLRMKRVSQGGAKPMDSESLQQAMQGALDQVMFVSKVIARIREYTHLHSPTMKPLRPALVMQSCAGLLDWEIERAGVRVIRNFPDEPLWIQADELMLQQVLVNLMRNAIEAMRSTAADQRRLELVVKRDGPQAELIVRDNGSGVSEQAEQTMFMPFVSTKPTGTGIGLNICRSFIELHNGRLWFSRNEDRGISFHAALPLVSPPVNVAASED